ncbi:MAG: ATP-grasp domain-containing protein [Spirochaetota bacterium]
MLFFKKRHQPFNLFVSVAAGNNQIPLIHAARALGFSIIAVDQNTAAPGFPLSDIRIQESIDNTSEIYKKLRELLIDGNITAVLSRSFGKAIRATAELCELLDIDYIPVASVDEIINKKKMKSRFMKAGIPSARFSPLSTRRKKPYEYPVIIKPSDGHAKSGVRLIFGKEELDRYLKMFQPRYHSFIIEEYIEGDEIIVFGIVQNGTFHLVEITDKVTTEPPFFADIIHSAPSHYSDSHQTVTQIGQSIAEAFSIRCSPLVIEMKVRNGEFFVIETVAEFGGESIPEHLIPRTQNINIFEQALCAMTKRPLSIQPYRKSRNHVVIKYIAGKKGALKSFTPIKPRDHDIITFAILKEIGSITSVPNSNHDRIGYVVATGRSREAAIEKCDNAIREMRLTYI